jgi:NADH:ubiquinone oxidoreductase subunit B-like Fe-S oxidoreductase
MQLITRKSVLFTNIGKKIIASICKRRQHRENLQNLKQCTALWPSTVCKTCAYFEMSEVFSAAWLRFPLFWGMKPIA